MRTDAAAAIQSHRRSGERGIPLYLSATTEETQQTHSYICLVTHLLFNPQIRPHFCCTLPFLHLFRHNQEGESIPVFQHLRDLHIMAVDAKRRLHFFYFLLESHLHHQSNCCDCRSRLTSRRVQWRPVTSLSKCKLTIIVRLLLIPGRPLSDFQWL